MMMIGEPTESPYDWRFQILGFRVRVTWLFWVIAAALGYRSALGYDNLYANLRDGGYTTPGLFFVLCVWIAATLASILIHELGHALAFRYYGIQSQIVLYHMGGLAIPTAGFLYPRAGMKRSLTDAQQMVISAAGPGLQFAAGILVLGLAVSSGMAVPEGGWLLDWISRIGGPSFGAGGELEALPKNVLTLAAVNFFVLVSLWWPLFNLLPVYPLDGGHIFQHAAAIVRRTDGRYEAHAVGAVVGFAVALWFFSRGSTINALLFLSLAMSNVQSLQMR